jgi:magnesium transporter
MSIFDRDSSRKAGMDPGALLHVGERKVAQTRITVIDYDEAHYEERELTTPDACAEYTGKPTITWVNVDGLHDVSTIEQVGRCFGAHHLVLEDIVDTNQRPKLDYEKDKYIFIVLKMFQHDAARDDVFAEQVSLLLGPRSVLSFQEQTREGDVFDPVRRRLRNQEGRMRRAGADHLAYSLLDAVVDGYFGVLERLGERVEALEEALVEAPGAKTLHDIHGLKRQLLFLRKAIWPLREVVSALQRGDSPLIAQETMIYLRDLHDHIIQVIDTVETLRDMTSGMLDIYLSSVSNRLNEVMKVLTIIATIFIPLTFIVGIYGMNFHHMPEIPWRWGYAMVWAVMLTVSLGMLAYFRRRRWL